MQTFVGKMMSLIFNTLSRLVIAFLPRSKCLLISWLQSLSTVMLEPKKTKSITVSMFSPSICHEVMGLDALILAFWMLSFKPAFSLSSFTPNSPFRLFSFSLLVLELFCLFLEQGNERQESQTLADKKDPPMFLFPLFLGSYLRYYWIHPRMEQSPVWKYWPLLPSGEKVKWLLWTKCFSQFSSVSVLSDSLQPHESQHARLPCPSPTPRVYSNSCSSRRWCHPAISSSVIPFSSCPQSLPASGSFTMS